MLLMAAIPQYAWSIPVRNESLVRDQPGSTLRRLFTLGFSASGDQTDPVSARNMARQAHCLRRPALGAGGAEVAARCRCVRAKAARASGGQCLREASPVHPAVLRSGGVAGSGG